MSGNSVSSAGTYMPSWDMARYAKYSMRLEKAFFLIGDTLKWLSNQSDIT